MYFGSLSSSESTTLSSNTFEVSNIYNCHLIDWGVLFKRILAVCYYLLNAFKAISMSINKNKIQLGICTILFELTKV